MKHLELITYVLSLVLQTSQRASTECGCDGATGTTRSRVRTCDTAEAGTDHLPGLMVCAARTQAVEASRDVGQKSLVLGGETK